MKVILGIVIVVFAALTLASSDKKDAVKVVDLAEELAKSREETKEIIKLRQEDDKLKQEDNKLRRKNEKLEQEVAELRREMRRDKSEIQKSMRDADAKITKSMRQRDENNTLELQNIIRNSFRQNDFTSELKKFMKKEIKEQLDGVDLLHCESGLLKTAWTKCHADIKQTKTYNHAFRSAPTLITSIRAQAYNGNKFYFVKVVRKESFDITYNLYGGDGEGEDCFFHLHYMACGYY